MDSSAAAAASSAPSDPVARDDPQMEEEEEEEPRDFKYYCSALPEDIHKDVKAMCDHVARAIALLGFLRRLARENKCYAWLFKHLNIGPVNKKGDEKTSEAFRVARLVIYNFVENAIGTKDWTISRSISLYLDQMIEEFEPQVKAQFPFTGKKSINYEKVDLKLGKKAAKVLISPVDVIINAFKSSGYTLCSAPRFQGSKLTWRRAIEKFQKMIDEGKPKA